MKKYIIVVLTVFVVGCKCTQCNERPSLKKDFDLLHVSPNIAYKSITIEDYKGWEKDQC